MADRHPLGGDDRDNLLLYHWRLASLARWAFRLVALAGGYIFIRILAFHHQHGDAIDEKDHIFAVAKAPIVPVELFGHIVDILAGIGIIHQRQIQLAVFNGVEELALVTEISEELTVTVDVGL